MFSCSKQLTVLPLRTENDFPPFPPFFFFFLFIFFPRGNNVLNKHMGKLGGRKAQSERLYLYSENSRSGGSDRDLVFGGDTPPLPAATKSGAPGVLIATSSDKGSFGRPWIQEDPSLSWRRGPNPSSVEARATGAALRAAGSGLDAGVL